MNSVQESKNELEASIRYAENAISSAKETIESMEFRQEMAQKQYAEQTGREQALEREVADLKDKNQGLYDDKAMLERCVADLKAQVNALEQPEQPTMPVIPKAVAISIFREGVAHGVSNACDELDNAADIEISETGYTGDFEVSFSKYIDLSEHLDLDWMRDKVGDYDEASVIEALKNLCVDKEFECRIHGVDDQEEKKND
tara:strand:- start:1765 stop:2367 length:603 start_codon:yes stop_codon:yes gene_type:complete